MTMGVICDNRNNKSSILGSKRTPSTVASERSWFESTKESKTTGLKADAMVLDLEDGVPLDRNDDARRLVVGTLQE